MFLLREYPTVVFRLKLRHAGDNLEALHRRPCRAYHACWINGEDHVECSLFQLLSAAGFVLLVLLTAAPATPQQAPGTLEGVVLDEQGEFLPGVTITIQDGSVDRTVVSDTEGKYRFTDLPQGFYNNLTAALDGFQTNRTFITITAAGRPTSSSCSALKGARESPSFAASGTRPTTCPRFLRILGSLPAA